MSGIGEKNSARIPSRSTGGPPRLHKSQHRLPRFFLPRSVCLLHESFPVKHRRHNPALLPELLRFRELHFEQLPQFICHLETLAKFHSSSWLRPAIRARVRENRSDSIRVPAPLATATLLYRRT
jgi:hypothetical protein